MKEPLLSVIVPVYNAEKYLRRCLDSLLLQDIKEEMEIIVINDSSQDNCFTILKEYGETYPNIIRVVDLRINQGAGVVRYIASKLSKGKYIGFVDSDDYLKSPQYFSRMLKSLEEEEADIAITGYSTFCDYIKGENSLVECLGISNIENSYYIFSERNMIEKVYYSASPILWLKVYKRNLYADNPFNTLTLTNEDNAVDPVLLFANKIIYVPSFDYIYFQRQGTLSDYTCDKQYSYDSFKRECIDWANYLWYENSVIASGKKPESLDFFIKVLCIRRIFGILPAFLSFFRSINKDRKKIAKETFSFMKEKNIKVKDLFLPALEGKKRTLKKSFLIFLAQISSVFKYLMPTLTLVFFYFINSQIEKELSFKQVKEKIKKYF